MGLILRGKYRNGIFCPEPWKSWFFDSVEACSLGCVWPDDAVCHLAARFDASGFALVSAAALCADSVADDAAWNSRGAGAFAGCVFSSPIGCGEGIFRFTRIIGRIYVGCVIVSAPLAIVVSIALADPILLPATIIQSTVWVATTGTGLYCARTGKIQQHKEWMIRSYPMAMVFIFVRTIGEIPAIARMGLVGVHIVVWSCIAVACFLPSFLISWQALAVSRRVVKARAAV